MASYVGVRPSEESWDDYGDAQTEMSVAPARPRGGVEAHSGRGPAARSGPTGGYTEEELAALAAQEDDDWGAPPAPRNPPYGASNPHRGGYAGSGYGAVLPPAPAQQGPPLGVGEHPCPKCSAACVQRTSNTPKNPGRQFVKCPNEGCGYFKWTDELGADGPAPAGGAGYGGYGGDAGHGSPSAKRRITGYTGAQGGSQGGYKAGYGYGGGEAPPPVPGSNTLQAAADGGVLRDRSNDTCYKCNGTGHWASNCPNQQVGAGGGAYDSAGGGGGAKSGSCFKCGQDGHWSRDCPNQGGGGSGNYGGGGGGYAGSRYKADGGADGAGYGAGGGGAYGGGGGGAKSGSCFKCGQDGHWSRDCPNQGGGGGGDGGYGGGGGGYGGGGGAYGGGRGAGYGGGGGGAKSGSCFKCGQDGHWSRDCPNQGGGGGGGYGGGGYGGGGAAGGKRKYGGGY